MQKSMDLLEKDLNKFRTVFSEISSFLGNPVLGDLVFLKGTISVISSYTSFVEQQINCFY